MLAIRVVDSGRCSTTRALVSRRKRPHRVGNGPDTTATVAWPSHIPGSVIVRGVSERHVKQEAVPTTTTVESTRTSWRAESRRMASHRLLSSLALCSAPLIMHQPVLGTQSTPTHHGLTETCQTNVMASNRPNT